MLAREVVGRKLKGQLAFAHLSCQSYSAAFFEMERKISYLTVRFRPSESLILCFLRSYVFDARICALEQESVFLLLPKSLTCKHFLRCSQSLAVSRYSIAWLELFFLGTDTVYTFSYSWNLFVCQKHFLLLEIWRGIDDIL